MNRELYRYYVIDRVHRGLRTEWKSQERDRGKHAPVLFLHFLLDRNVY